MDDDLLFDLKHLNGFAVITEPCTAIVRCKTTVREEYLYTEDGYNRWILDLYVITQKDLDYLRRSYENKDYIKYKTASQYFLKGALWESSVIDIIDLPIKKENLIAVFDYVDGILMCTQISLIPKTNLDVYSSAKDILKGLSEMTEIIKNIDNER